MRFKLLPFLSVLLFQITPEALAKPYFPPTTIKPQEITKPLKVGGAEWASEIEYIKGLQAHADKNEVEAAREEINMKPAMVAQKVDPNITKERYPALYKLLYRVDDTSRTTTRDIKAYWNTKRPYQSDNDIKPLVETPQNPSYPSGHTTGSFVWAEVLSLVMPEKKTQFFARAEEIAQHRILVGVHYPHDISGGKALSKLIFKKLQDNKQFQHDLAEAKKEQR